MPGYPCCCAPPPSGIIFANAGATLHTQPKTDYHNPPATMVGATDITPTFPAGLAGDMFGLGLAYSSGFLFFSAIETGDTWRSLYRCNLDGTGLLKIVNGGSFNPGGNAGGSGLDGMEIGPPIVDLVNGGVYFQSGYTDPTSRIHQSYWTCAYDGSGASQLFELPNFYTFRFMSVDGAAGVFFFSYADGGGTLYISTSDLSGANQTQIFTISGDLASLWSLSVDPIQQRLWFAYPPVFSLTANFCNYDGSGLTAPANDIVVSAPPNGVAYTAVDAIAGEIYVPGVIATIYDGSTQYGPSNGPNCTWGLAIGP